MIAKIYYPTKNLGQSGARNNNFILELANLPKKYIDSSMGWTVSVGTRDQIKLKFSSLESAQNYAKSHHIPYEIIPEKKRKLQRKSYSNNFI